MIRNLQYILKDYFADKFLNEQDTRIINDYMLECIIKAQNPIITSPFTNYSENLDCLFALTNHFVDIEDLLSKQLNNRKFIELGPGAAPLFNWALKYNISEYVGVEPFNHKITESNLPKDPRIELVKDKEALEFLLGQEDESAIIMSMGVLCQELFSLNNDDYFKFIIKEIYRITPKKGFTINTIYQDIPSRNYFIEAGFKAVTDLRSNIIYTK